MAPVTQEVKKEIWAASRALVGQSTGIVSGQERVIGTFGSQLRIDDAVQIESGRDHLGVAQHDVNLTSVVCLVIKKMAARNVRRLDVVFA